MTKPLPLALQKRGAWLLHQQCWCWGHDVRREAGNLLLAQGFSQSRPPQGVAGCTQYSLQRADGRAVKLWGFGMFLGGADGLYLNRYGFAPVCVSLASDVWQAGALQKKRRAPDPQHLLDAVRWIAQSEQAVGQLAGSRYRADCLATLKGARQRSEDLRADWCALAGKLSAWSGIALA